MDVLEYYINLKCLPEYQQAHEILISKQEIAGILFCSSRNVHYILQRWIQEGYVDWKSQRGRGKKSSLTFLKSLDEAVLLHVKKLVQKEKVKEAMSFALQNKFSTGLKETLLSTIQKAFGIQHIEDHEEMNDILHIPLQYGLNNMNPFFVTIATEAHILSEVFDTLVRYNLVSKTIEPHLSHGWEASEDYSTWTFYIRKGIRFHDGSTLTSKDVQWTFQTIINEEINIPNKWLLEGIQDITIENKFTISFHLNEGNHVFPNFLSAIFTAIIPAESDIKDSPHLIGTGPYRIEHIDKDKMVLKAFDYHFSGRPFIDKIHMWKLPESNFNPLNFFTHDHLGKNNTEGSTFTIHDNGSNYIIFNMKKGGAHQSRFFRQAVSEMIDSREMVQQLGGPREGPSTGFIPERSSYKNIKHSIEKAKHLLSKSNYQGETIHLAALRYEDFLEDAHWMEQKLNEICIEVKVHPIELSDIYNEDLMLSFDAIYTGEGFEDNIELAILILLRNEFGIRRFLSPSQLDELDKGFESLKKQPDYESFIQVFQAVEDKLKEDGTIIFTVHSSNQNTFQSNLQGIQISGYGWPVFRKLWIKKE
ncbi:ABC transporter substrate-binding protein [Oceanobacillus polygoni]|uniref:MarR-like DNA-binding transcriptional regulator SgrR of sgrS sRNA n=1 Tax=Oceanobacillus polygoni TaxID=1235259 RepID=A0A9X1CDV5_9BACI|nr:ABC transporter substrate-binding protein [Oceanobacillus polygoni]MBP2080184.1 MarR-like DNA-binding transcriptional regulator SgrR of sgrS sRNA [Oceanobacillus polygoni]